MVVTGLWWEGVVEKCVLSLQWKGVMDGDIGVGDDLLSAHRLCYANYFDNDRCILAYIAYRLILL